MFSQMFVCPRGVGGRGVGFPACITGYMTRGSASRGICPTPLNADPLDVDPPGCRPPLDEDPSGCRSPPLPQWDTMGYGQQAGDMHPIYCSKLGFNFH